jgi:DNA polymerase III alpha subunit
MYVPLRVHGHHSLLTGVDAPAALVERARALGLTGMALADVDTLAGLVDFLVASRTAGLRPIVAAELSPVDGDTTPGRLIALVRDAAGYRNLCKLVSARQLGADPGAGGDPARPFRLVEQVVRHREGLIFLADHPRLVVALAGRVPHEDLFAAVSPASLGRAAARADALDCGGTRNAHLTERSPARRGRDERADPGAAPQEDERHALEPPKVPPPARAVRAAELIDAARASGVATLAVPDVHYAAPGARLDHRVRAAIKHNALLDDLPAAWVAPRPAHLLPPAELAALFRDVPDVPGPQAVSDAPGAQAARDAPGALTRTLAVAERCTFAPELGGTLLPTIELEPGESAWSRLCNAAFEGARRRYRPLERAVLQRLEYELATIDQLGFAPYFLLVDSIAGFARAAGIPCVGRGSAADSLVAYCLGLTDADPLRYGLLFERFLNPARRDRPDIDLDFCWRRRDEVIEHVYELFGPERTAMISTLNRCGLRAAFREAALALGIPPAEVDRWSRRLPHHAPHGDVPHDGGEGGDETGTVRTDGVRTGGALAAVLRGIPEAAGLSLEVIESATNDSICRETRSDASSPSPINSDFKAVFNSRP